jgi:hypothetical protein
VVGDEVADDDLDVAVVVEVRQGDGHVIRIGRGRALPLEGAVVFEGDQAAGLHRHDLDQAVAVDVAERRGDRGEHELGDLVVQRAGGPVEHVDVTGGRGDAVGGDGDDVRDVAEVDLAVAVVVGQVGDQRADAALVLAVRAPPLPLHGRDEALGDRLLAARADGVVVDDLAARRRRRGVGVGVARAGADVVLEAAGGRVRGGGRVDGGGAGGIGRAGGRVDGGGRGRVGLRDGGDAGVAARFAAAGVTAGGEEEQRGDAGEGAHTRTVAGAGGSAGGSTDVAVAAGVAGDAVLERALGLGEGAGEVAGAAAAGGEGEGEAGGVEDGEALVVAAEGGEAGVDELEGGDEVAGVGGGAGVGERLDGDAHGRARVHGPSIRGRGRARAAVRATRTRIHAPRSRAGGVVITGVGAGDPRVVVTGRR